MLFDFSIICEWKGIRATQEELFTTSAFFPESWGLCGLSHGYDGYMERAISLLSKYLKLFFFFFFLNVFLFSVTRKCEVKLSLALNRLQENINGNRGR